MSNKSRKKKLKRKLHNQKTFVYDTPEFRYSKISVGYFSASDDVWVKLLAKINNQTLHIYGSLNTELIVDDGVKIVGYRNELTYKDYDKEYNCSDLGILMKDAPNLYKLLKAYDYYVGDTMDSRKTPETLNLEMDWVSDKELLLNPSEEVLNILKSLEE